MIRNLRITSNQRGFQSSGNLTRAGIGIKHIGFSKLSPPFPSLCNMFSGWDKLASLAIGSCVSSVTRIEPQNRVFQ